MNAKRIMALILSAALVLCLAACGEPSTTPNGSGSGGGTNNPSSSGKIVESAEVTTQPTKTDYFVGESFDGTGGVITVTYADGTTEQLPMTAANVTNNLNTENVGKSRFPSTWTG